ncbi:MAG: hypothetical protein JSS76_16285 [Bacteroidetes bacterium]|nr:hypothetical protein [Bacteroidota bacterium]
MEQQSKTYIDGFNVGFKMRQYNPELLEKLKPSLSSEKDYERGVIEGAEEYDRTKQKTNEQDFENIRNNNDKTKSLEQSR